jgi:OFA family oxalate/formate antiporter-like MFS transporter
MSANSARWRQLLLGLIVMMSISSPQYVWTLFVKPFQSATGAALPATQFTFSLLIVLQTLFSPAQGYLVDRFGPRLLVACGAALSGLGWVLAAHAGSLIGLYLTYGLFCGIGTGVVYVGVVGLMARWFPDRRGFAIGLAAAGYGMGAMLTTFPIDATLRALGLPSTLTIYGIVLGAVGAAAAVFLRSPRAGEAEAQASATSGVSPREMLRTPLFWLMFAMMTMMSTGGLMATSNFANFARDFGVANSVVLGMAALPLALTVDRLLNGFTRPFFGWVSDRIGREATMTLAFSFEALAILALLTFRADPLGFVVLSGLVFFGWGEIFSLFPSILTDTFGARHATTNYGFLYIAQGVGSILGGPVAALIHDSTGTWTAAFGVSAAMDVLTAGLAWFVLRPMRRDYLTGASHLVAGHPAPVV